MVKEDRGLLDETLSSMFSSLKYCKTYLFYAHMIAQCSIKIERSMDAPAGVAFMHDHYNLYINPEKFDMYTLEERLAILKHEMLHILNGHVLRTDDRIHLPWNLSTDCAINQFIDELHLPEGAITPKNFPVEKCPIKETSENYYDLLKQENDNECKSCNGTGKTQNGECEDCNGSGYKSKDGSEFTKIDTHETWQESEGDKELQSDLTKKMMEKSTNETIKSKGNVPQELSDWMELFNRKAELNWKKVLRGIVGNKKVNKRSTIMRKDRRFPNRMDLKGKTKDRIFNLLVITDVSGSVSDKALISLLSEIRHVCDVTKTAVDLIQIDTEAHIPEKLSKKSKLINRKACGGTILHHALDKAKEHNIEYDALVVTTDGYLVNSDVLYFARTNKKVIWLIEKGGDIMPSMNEGKMKAFQLKEI